MEYEFVSDESEGDHYLMGAKMVTAPSILDALSRAGIFSTSKRGSRVVQFTDGCDDHYSLSLDHEKLLALSDEIRELAHSLKS